jgi:hypothetical protein
MDTSYSDVADILFHAAMSLGSSRTSTVRSALVDSVKYLHWTDDVKIWRPFHDSYLLYCLVSGHSGEVWPHCGGYGRGSWLSPTNKFEQIMTVLFVYEYVVQELHAARSPADLDYS